MPREEMVIETGGGVRRLRRLARQLGPVVQPDSALDVDKWGLWLTTFNMAEDLRRIEEHENG